MIAQILRLERPSLKWLPLILIPAAYVCLILGGPKQIRQEIFIWGIFLPIVPLAGLLGMAKQWTCDPLIAVLPVPIRALYLARVINVMGTLVVCWGLILGFALLVLTDSTLPGFQAANCTLLVGILPYLALQAWHLHRPGFPKWIISLVCGIQIGPSMLLEIWLRRQPPATADLILLGSILCAAAIVSVGWFLAPAALIHQPRLQRTSTSPGGAPAILPRRITPFLPVLRSIYGWQYLMWLPILFTQGASQPGYFPAIMTGFAVIAALPRSLWIQSLPVPRRPLLLAVLGPAILALLAGHWVVSFQKSRMPVVRLVETSCGQADVAVPFDLWRPAPSNSNPEIRAPWGETYRPPVSTLLGLPVYNPFSSGCNNSDRFLQWQLRHAEFANGRGLSSRIRLLDTLFLCLMAVASTWVLFLTAWSRLRRTHRWTIISVAAIGWLALASANLSPNRFDVLGLTSAWLGLAFPNLAPWLVAAAILLLYRMVERVFLESEYTLKTPPQPAGR